MKGVQFIIDKRGNPTSVILDLAIWHEILAIWHEIWEDIYDIKAIEAAKQEGGEPIPWEQVKAEMDAKLAAMNAADN